MATEKLLKDANALKAVFDERYDDAFMQSHTRPNIAYWEGYASGVNWGRNTIADAPTVDAVEVVHSQFIKSNEKIENYGYYYTCMKCYAIMMVANTKFHDTAPNWCALCGAKMDGGKSK